MVRGSRQKNFATVKFYSESNALDFALNHFNEIEILTPQSIAKEKMDS